MAGRFNAYRTAFGDQRFVRRKQVTFPPHWAMQKNRESAVTDTDGSHKAYRYPLAVKRATNLHESCGFHHR